MAIGAVSDDSSTDEKGKIGLDVSSSSTVDQAAAPASVEEQEMRPTSVLGPLATKTRCLEGSHPLSHAV